MKTKVKNAIENSLKKIGVSVEVELTPAKGHGDFSTNVAMKLSKELKDSPTNVAAKIIANMEADFIEKAEVAGPGFINIFLKGDVLAMQVKNIIKQGEKFGSGSQGKYINVEYVSANPTGHLHLGHARGAAIGSALVNVLRFAGNKVDSEYYINDAGNQIEILGISVWTRYKNLFGFNIELPEDSYRGSDIIDCAEYLKESVFVDKYKDSDFESVKNEFKSEAKKYLLDVIKKHLKQYNVVIDLYSSEQAIYDNNMIKPALEKLKDHSYELDKALWLKTTTKGDDKDRVMIKSDGALTYFTPDIAYHNIKLARGYDELINIWGADHVGYIKRMAIALEFLGLPNDKLDILTVQLVKLMKDNEELKMSKRKGTTYTLQELIEEVGVDASRWFMLDRSSNSEFVFDINVATAKTSDNPVFTIQYTHARANQLINRSSKKTTPGNYEGAEIELINILNKFPELIDSIAKNHKVHLLPQYLMEVARSFNSWYSNSKIINSEREESLIALVKATKQVIANGLTLLGISAPEKM